MKESQKKLTGSNIDVTQGDEEAGRLFETALIERDRENEAKEQEIERLASEITLIGRMFEFIRSTDNILQEERRELENFERSRIKHGGFPHE